MIISRLNKLRIVLVIWLTLHGPAIAFALSVDQDIIFRRVYVSNAQELHYAVAQANKSANGMAIYLQDGRYEINSRVILSRANTQLRSVSDNPDSVILVGGGMKKSASVEILVDVQASNITIRGITFSDSANHLIQVRAEYNVDNFTLSNCVLRDAYEQLLKVSGGKDPEHPYSNNGLIENCIFEYSAGIGPQYYIGGIDAHRIRHWLIQNNQFRNIASPAGRIAEHAIHLWNDSSDNSVLHNIISNCDRGIGFGMGDRAKQNSGGIIANNRIEHNNATHPFADAGIILESSPGTQVINNTIFMEHAYPNAIEYRFTHTTDVLIRGNISNKAIVSRDGAEAQLKDNVISSLPAKLVDNILYYFSQLSSKISN